MQSYPARYASFNPPQRSKSSSKGLPRWPHPDSYLANPTSLATAGFYFNPSSTTPDAVSCFICDKGLADWDPDDDPAQIHVAKCPKCPWAILICIKDTDADGNVNFTSSSRLPTSRAMEKARLATFGPESNRWWPHDVKNKGPTSKAMAKTGFIYTPMDPKDDTCTCIYCNIQLGGWQPDDDPMEEHRSRQAKNGPCPFFTHASDPPLPPAPALTKKRTRARSKPPTNPAPSPSDDDEYHPPGTKSSTRAPAPSMSSKKASGSAKSAKPKSVKKTIKAKTIEDEVVTEYHVALEDASPKPRPKSRRTASRASSRSRSRASSRSRSRASSAKNNTTADESESVVSSTKSSQSKRLDKSSSAEHDHLPSSVSSFKKSSSRPSSSKTPGESEEREQSTRSRSRLSPKEVGHPRAVSKSRGAAKGKGKGKAEILHTEVDELERKPELDVHPKPVPPPRPALNGHHHAPQPPPPPPPAQFKSFQSPEDEEFAREEEALEEQARELMLADPTLALVTTPLRDRATKQYQVIPDASSQKLNGVPPIEKGKGKAKMSRTEIAMDINTLAPSTPPPPKRGAATVKPVPSSTVKFPHLVPDDTLMALTETERAMTVEQWVRHEMDRQYEQLRSDGRQKIDAFKARAEEVAKQIESL